MIGYLCRWLLWIVGWPFGADLRRRFTRRSQGSFGGQAVATLLISLGATTTGFLLYVQKEPEPTGWVVGVYTGVLAIPAIGIGIMLFGGSRGRKAYDVGTLMLARWAFTSSLVLTVGLNGGYWTRNLPGQGIMEIPLSVRWTEQGEWKKSYPEYGIHEKDVQVAAIVPFSPQTYKDIRPTGKFDVEIILSDENKIAWNWEIGPKVGGKRVQKVDLETKTLTAPEIMNPTTIASSPTRVRVQWRDLEHFGQYVLEIRLHPRPNSKISPACLKAMIESDLTGIVSAKLIVER